MDKKQRERRDGVWRDPDSGIWRYRFMHKGKRYFGADPTWKNKGEAKAARDRRRIAVREGREDQAEAETNFQVFVEKTFLPWVETNLSKGTYKNYKCRTPRLVKAFGSLDLSQVSTFGVERFKRDELERITKRKRQPLPGTVNSYLVVLGSVFTVAEELGRIERGRRPKIKLLQAENRRLRYLSVDEERRLLLAAAARGYLQDVIVVALATGLRRDELFSLRAEDVDLRLNLLTVVQGKGGKSRTVPIDRESEAARILARLIRERRGKYLFASPWAKDKACGVDESLAAAAKQAEIEGVTLHTLRHTFGTRLVASGVDLRTVQELMGHADIQTTMIYAHVVEGSKHAAIARLKDYQENCHEITTANVVELRKRQA
jgi:site-specific recombinase XerD